MMELKERKRCCCNCGRYLNAFQKMIAERKNRGLKCNWQTGEDVFNWWMDYEMPLDGQENLFDIGVDE